MSDLIYERLAQIMADVPAIPKGQTNKQQGYAFRGIDDMYQALHSLFVKHQVVILPKVVETEYVQQRTGRNDSLATDARLTIRYRFVTVDGSSESITVQGESRDFADKATNQAMSGALKYGLLQMFLIPLQDTHEADHRSPTIEPAPDPTIVAKKRLVKVLGSKTEAADFWKLHQSLEPDEIVQLAEEEAMTRESLFDKEEN